MNKQVHQLKATSTDEDALYFRITFLEARVRELEHLVHRLLKDRVDQSEADTWLRFSGAEGMTDRGSRPRPAYRHLDGQAARRTEMVGAASVKGPLLSRYAALRLETVAAAILSGQLPPS
jgi:hypothetical protein